MHYSNWLIGVKNRASIRNACKTPPYIDRNRRATLNVDFRNNNPRPDGKTSEQTVTTHLWKKGKAVNYAAVKTSLCQISGPAANKRLAWRVVLNARACCAALLLLNAFCFNIKRFDRSESNVQPEFPVSSSGQSGGRRRVSLPRRRSANRAG